MLMGQVHLDVADYIATIILDNPDKRNAVDAQMSEQLAHAYEEVRNRDDIRVAIITGAGEQAFCAGGYIPSYLEMGVVGEEGSGQRTPLPKPWRIWKPFIAAIRGACVGGGFGLALACDLRVAAEDVKLGPSGLRRGVIQGAQQTQRLVRLVGLSRALEVLLLSRYLNGREAYDLGIVQQVVPSEDVLVAAQNWATTIAGFSPWAVQTTKRLAYEGMDLPWDEALAWEEDLTVQSFSREDAREGFSSFVEHRPAQFGRP
jgi:enoyl-CoA hydratase/carnithine racemase